MVTPDEFLDFAAGLRGSNDEIDLRNVISRSYYATLLLAEQKLPKINTNVNVANAGSHEKTIFQFSKSTIPHLIQIGNSLTRLKRGRITSDYKIKRTVTRTESDTHFLMAEITFLEIDKI